jgi:FAD binding domain
VRGGGHSVAGRSSCDGGVVIDLVRMRAVTVDPTARRASVQGGPVWGDVDQEAQAFGLVVPAGVVSETGVGGLTLGGGEGWVRREYGLTVDSLRAATVVCADGSVHVASADNDADLFWALRGGGGNFGVVTHFDFDAHPLGPIVAFAGVMYSTRDAGEILPRWRGHVTDAPDEVTSVAVGISMRADPGLPEAVHGQSCLVIGGVYVGDVDEGMKVLQPLRELGTPLADISGPTPFVGVNSPFDPFFPMGTYQSYWKGQNLDVLPDEAFAVIAAKADSRPSPVTLALVFQMGGAINRVGSTDTAYSERTAPVDVLLRWDLGGSRRQRSQHRMGAGRLRTSSPIRQGKHVHQLHRSSR